MKSARDASHERDASGDERPKKRSRVDVPDSQSQVAPPVTEQILPLPPEQDLVLPLELWRMIFERLLSKADLQSFDRVCRQFHHLINENYFLWYSLRWPQKDYDRLSMTVDVSFEQERVFVLVNGDVAILLPSGAFSLLPVTQSDWRVFEGHADPGNFHIARPIKTIISLHHNQLATCADDGIRIWNRLTAELVQHLPPQHLNDKPFKLLCTANGSLVSASPDGSIYLYPSDGTPAKIFELGAIVEPGELKGIYFWEREIVAEFSNIIVSWNKHGRAPTRRFVISTLQQQLLEQVAKFSSDEKILNSGLITDNDWIYYNNPDNKGLAFNWDFYFTDYQIEIVLNKTFSFMLDFFSDKSPVFLGVRYKRVAVRNEQRNCYMLRQLTANLYDMIFSWDSQAGEFKSRAEITIPEPVKFYTAQIPDIAFFVLHDNRAVLWDVNLNIQRYLSLEVPEVPADMQELYQYGNDEWNFNVLLTKELLGIHKMGITIIWDMQTGNIKQHFVTDYLCDASYRQHVLQMRNNDLLIQCRDTGTVDEESDWVNKQDHVCIYRFLPPPRPQPVDAEDKESGILGTMIKR